MKPSDIVKNNRSDLREYLEDHDLQYYSTMMNEAADAGDEKGVVHYANLAWYDLPDTQSIRTHAFFTLCDIAEYMFDEETMREPELA